MLKDVGNHPLTKAYKYCNTLYLNSAERNGLIKINKSWG